MVDFIYHDISSFDEDFFESSSPISYIGTGSLGGKANGLAFIKETLDSEFKSNDFPGIEIGIPKMVVILTDVFDSFMMQNNLIDIALSDASDERIAMAFQKAELPFNILGILRTFISKIHSPLAIRSSSLLEDALYEPFAGIYGTKMTPNIQFDTDTRFRKLTEAIKFVYASTYFRAAKDYFKATRHEIGDEKMAVIIQEVVGARHNDRFYPEISGTLRSYNYYSFGHAKPEEGVANLALGLGKTIVDGGFSWSFSPAFPKTGPPFNSIGDMLKITQTEFWSVNMGKPPDYDPVNEIEYLISNDLACAEADGTLNYLASTYDISADRVWTGLNGNGPRILNFAPILVSESFPLNDLIKKILDVCEMAVKAPVEIEFAMTITNEVKKFGFLQVRPIAVSKDEVNILPEESIGERVFIASGNVLGNGILRSIRDIVYVDFQEFDAKISFAVAAEIELLNRKLVDENRPYLLIGYGRWGTSDPTAGIPIQWPQISGAKVIVEAPVDMAYVDMSQGSHFFHNVSSFKVLYFSMPPGSIHTFDRDWLNKQKVIEGKNFVKHIQSENELFIKADGRTGKGVIFK